MKYGTRPSLYNTMMNLMNGVVTVRKWLLMLVLVLALVSSAMADGTVLLDGGDDGYPGVTLYKGPSAYSDEVGYVYGGTEAEVLDSGSGFVHVRIGQMTGWAAKTQAKETTAAVANGRPAGAVYGSGATRYQFLLNAPNGDQIAALAVRLPVTVLAMTADSNWLLVTLEDGTTGYLPVEAVLPTDGMAEAYVSATNPTLRLHLRELPTTKCETLGSYYCGTKVARILAKAPEDGWTRVAVCGQKGWMKTEYLAFGSSVGEWLPPLGVVQDTDETGLNLRTAPDYNAEVIDRYAPGTTVEIMAGYGIWAHVRTQDGHAGYMLLKHLGGDQPASLQNDVLLAEGCTVTADDCELILPSGVALHLLDARPVASWAHTQDGYAPAMPETVIVQTDAYGILTLPVSIVDMWTAEQAEAEAAGSEMP